MVMTHSGRQRPRRTRYTAIVKTGRQLAVSLLVAALLFFAGLRAQAPAPGTDSARHVDRVQLMRDVAMLASPGFQGRGTGTAGGLKARAWIAEQFRAIGVVQGGTDGYMQPFTIRSRDIRNIVPGGQPLQMPLVAANVVGRLPGRDARARTIVITAHYDHLGVREGVVYPGADDNASGVAVLLAAARHFKASSSRHQIVFATLDAEELGLHGAKTLVASALIPQGEVALNVNLDMVGRNTANEIYAAGPYHTPSLTPILLNVQKRALVRIRFGHDRPTGAENELEDWTQSSDHRVFHEAGIPFVYFGAEDHGDYHKPTDTVDRIDPRFFGNAADMIVEAIRVFDLTLP
jgi:hypothetical protein